MKVKDVKHKVTLDDFEHRLLVGCVNVARTMHLEQTNRLRMWMLCFSKSLNHRQRK